MLDRICKRNRAQSSLIEWISKLAQLEDPLVHWLSHCLLLRVLYLCRKPSNFILRTQTSTKSQRCMPGIVTQAVCIDYSSRLFDSKSCCYSCACDSACFIVRPNGVKFSSHASCTFNWMMQASSLRIFTISSHLFQFFSCFSAYFKELCFYIFFILCWLLKLRAFWTIVIIFKFSHIWPIAALINQLNCLIWLKTDVKFFYLLLKSLVFRFQCRQLIAHLLDFFWFSFHLGIIWL